MVKTGLSQSVIHNLNDMHQDPYVADVYKLTGAAWERDYKVIAIEKATGAFKSMTIREGLMVDG